MLYSKSDKELLPVRLGSSFLQPEKRMAEVRIQNRKFFI